MGGMTRFASVGGKGTAGSWCKVFCRAKRFYLAPVRLAGLTHFSWRTRGLGLLFTWRPLRVSLRDRLITRPACVSFDWEHVTQSSGLRYYFQFILLLKHIQGQC
jgi:hypothetical protein